MSPKCAFKVTTELQTLYSFKSPGNIEMALSNFIVITDRLGKSIALFTIDIIEAKIYIYLFID